jgi:hypothetical protein
MANHAENQPWPSLEWAGWIFDRASFVLIGSLVIGAAATVVIVWMGIVKEHHWDLRREAASEKIATVELRAAGLERQSEALRKDTAEANARAAEAQLELEKFRASRKLDTAQEARFISAVISFAGTPFDITVTLESEPQGFAAQIAALLESAGWIWKDKNNAPGLSISFGKHQAGLLNTGPPLGVEIDVSRQREWEPIVIALGSAFKAAGFEPVLNVENDKSASPDAIHLYFGTKR